VLLETLIESQQRTQTAMLEAVAQISQSSIKQSEVLAQYLKLFQTPGEPVGWRHDDEVDEAANNDDLMKMGFPVNGSESEQAEFVLNHLGNF
jgi:hypothetical protein